MPKKSKINVLKNMSKEELKKTISKYVGLIGHISD